MHMCPNYTTKPISFLRKRKLKVDRVRKYLADNDAFRHENYILYFIYKRMAALHADKNKTLPRLTVTQYLIEAISRKTNGVTPDQKGDIRRLMMQAVKAIIFDRKRANHAV